jgi:TolB-like protein/DNA-binding winged helix-turn-helix (wHTH) protein/tetratricopeptide (TPR) repeat protein
MIARARAILLFAAPSPPQAECHLDTLATIDALQFERFRLDRRGGGLSRLDDCGVWRPVPVGSRALDVLCVLAERQGDLVSRDEIIRAVWPNVTVEEHNLVVQISALRRVLDTNRAQGSCIQTVPGRGYRFVVPVTRLGAGSTSTTLSTPPAEAGPVAPYPTRVSRRIRIIAGVAGAVLLVVAVAATGWHFHASRGDSPAPRLSLAVLPFDNLSGDGSEDYLAAAISDDLTTDLSHIPEAVVIAHASARAVRNRNLDVHQIGQELAVRYVIEGSVRRIGTALRINVQLVSTETGSHLWADRFDRELSDLVAGRDDVLARIRGALGFSLIDVEAGRSRRERPSDPDALDLILQARWWTNQPPSRDRMQRAQALYEQALRRDPNSVPAMTGLANIMSEQNMNWAGQWLSAEAEQLAVKLVADALALAPSSEEALVAHVRLLHGQTMFKELLEPSQRLVELYPSNPEGYHHLARAMQFEGRFADAVALFDKAIRLDPLEPRVFQRYGFMAFSMMMAGRYDESAAWFTRALAANPDAPPPLLARRYRNMSASLALAGRLDEARQAAREADRLWPFDTARSTYPLDIRSPALVAHELVFQRGLRLAGVRDHAEENADFGVEPDITLHPALAGYTPLAAPGAKTIRTGELVHMLDAGTGAVLVDPGTHYWGRSLPGAVAVSKAGLGDSLDDRIQLRLRRRVTDLTGGDLARPIIAIGWNSESFDGYNLALRLVALGYANVHWYRGGREAWEVAGLPETPLTIEDR